MRVVLISMNDIGRYALEMLAPAVELVALFTVRERGKHYMDSTDFTGPAGRHGVPIVRVDSINDPVAAEQLAALKPDYCMTIGWKQIVKDPVLTIPRLGWIGGHPAYLLLHLSLSERLHRAAGPADLRGARAAGGRGIHGTQCAGRGYPLGKGSAGANGMSTCHGSVPAGALRRTLRRHT